LDTGAALAPSAAAAEDIEAEEIAKNFVEIVEDGFVEAAASVGGDTGVAEAVVGGAPCRRRRGRRRPRRLP